MTGDGRERELNGAATRRCRLVCRGAVQGVGFRPTVHRVARDLHLSGWVRNGPEGAVVEVEGPVAVVTEFLVKLPASMPPLARLEGFDVLERPVEGAAEFVVLESETGPRRGALVPPDAALCDDCRRDMEDAADRRSRYPFTTCTNCGPRFTLCESFPYDRARTSMACFPFCPDCAREYADPADRRFHAEPVCCPACGPRLRLLGPEGDVRARGTEAVASARAALESDAIVAVKGIGGFQLACRAASPEAVGRLRDRKRRPTKPFAVMARGLEEARRIARLRPEDEALLRSARGPIVLAPRLASAPVAPGIAPGIGDVGVMLPTTPLHVELFRGASYEALVMTSGNAGDEPICRSNREAIERLRPLADLVLLHDRDVVRRVDDSVVRAVPRGHLLVRRSRGWVPEPVPLPEASPQPVLALGGHLQVTACVASGDRAFPSQHVGDLDTESARRFLDEVATGLEEFLEVEATVVAVDLHPDYASTWAGERLARRRGARLVRVQHHVAHAAAVLAEHRAFPRMGERAAAIVLDGTGFGPDGAAWGGEWLLLEGDLGWRRQAHLREVPLVGGERAVRAPWRVAAAALALEGESDLLRHLPIASLVEPGRLAEVARLALEGNWPRATGAGRVFEAAGALLGLAAENGWEGEAAARFEALAATAPGSAEPWAEVVASRAAERRGVPGSGLLAAAARRLDDGQDEPQVAAGFHATFCSLAADAAARAFPEGVRRIALAGGCFVNRILLDGLTGRLEAAGYEVLVPRGLPPGDGGLSYGQAVVAALSVSRGVEPEERGVL